MCRSAWTTFVAWTVLLSSAVGFAQDAKRPPTIGQRLDQFRKNLFKDREDEKTVEHQQQQMRSRHSAAPRHGGQTSSRRPDGSRSSQSAAPDSHSQTRSSRRTFQPGYQPGARQPEPFDDPAEAVTAAAPSRSTKPVMADIPSGMPSGYAGPARSRTSSPDAETREPAIADHSPSEDVEPVDQQPPIDSTDHAAGQQADSAPSAIGDETSPPEAIAADERATAARSKRASRTLEERLAAVRSLQSSNKSASSPASQRTNSLRTSKDDGDAPPTVVPTVARSRDSKAPSAPLASEQTATDPSATAQLPARGDSTPPSERVARASAHRVARADQHPPLPKSELPDQSTPHSDAPTSTVSTEAGSAMLFKRQSPVLSVETAGPRTIKIGTPAPYTITMQNSGDVAAQEVLVSVKLPEWAEIASAEPQAGSTRNVVVDGNPCLQWLIPALDPRSRASLSLSVVPHKSRPFDLAVQYTHTPSTSQALVEVQEPKLVMNLAGPDEVYFGEREVYKLTLSNPGTGDAENVVVRLLPTSAGDEQAVSHPIGKIAAGESKVVELELTARQADTLEIKAEADADGGLHAAIDEIIIVRKAELQAIVQGPKMQYAGTPATFRVQVHNPGNATAKNVQVSALLPRGATYLSSSDGGTIDADQRKIGWTIGNLRAGADATVAFKCLLNAPGANTAQVACHAEGEVRAQGAATTDVEALADLVLDAVDPQGPIPVGQEVTYEVHIKNRGTKGAENVEVVAFFSPGIEPVAVEPGEHEIAAGQIAFDPIAVLNAGQEIVYHIRAKADRAGVHTFRTEVTCPTLGTKLSTDETTRFYLDDSVDPDEVVAESGKADADARDDEQQETTSDETSSESMPAGNPSVDEQPDDHEPAAGGSEEPQPE